MTSKELLYVEDALGHEKYLQAQCKATAEQLQDQELKQYVTQLAQNHQQIYDQMYKLL
jgi:hypothetical protein